MLSSSGGSPVVDGAPRRASKHGDYDKEAWHDELSSHPLPAADAEEHAFEETGIELLQGQPVTGDQLEVEGVILGIIWKRKKYACAMKK